MVHPHQDTINREGLHQNKFKINDLVGTDGGVLDSHPLDRVRRNDIDSHGFLEISHSPIDTSFTF
jgi:hypothetical protein